MLTFVCLDEQIQIVSRRYLFWISHVKLTYCVYTWAMQARHARVTTSQIGLYREGVVQGAFYNHCTINPCVCSSMWRRRKKTFHRMSTHSQSVSPVINLCWQLFREHPCSSVQPVTCIFPPYRLILNLTALKWSLQTLQGVPHPLPPFCEIVQLKGKRQKSSDKMEHI